MPHEVMTQGGLALFFGPENMNQYGKLNLLGILLKNNI